MYAKINPIIFFFLCLLMMGSEYRWGPIEGSKFRLKSSSMQAFMETC